MHDILQKIIQTSGAKIYSVLLGIITLSITARWLGPEGRGIVVTITTWMILFVEVGEFSLSSVLIFKATNDRDKTWLSGMLGALSMHTVIITVICWSTVTLLYVGGGHWGLPDIFGETPLIPLIIGFLIVPFLLWETFTKSLLNIEDRLNIFNRFQIVGSSTNSLSIVYLVVILGFGVIGVLLSKLVWQMIIAWGGIRELLRRKASPIHFNLANYKDLLTNGMKIHLNIIGAAMLTNVDIIMVSAYLGNEQTGIYQLAVQTSLMMMIVPYAVMTVLQGELTRKGVQGVWPYQRKLLFLTLAFMIIAALITAYTAKWWLIWLASEAFRDTIVIFQYLLVWVLVTTATVILSVQWIGRGLFLQLSAVSVVTGIINISLNALFLPKYGIMGAVWATMGAAAFALLVNIGMFIYIELDTKKSKTQFVYK